MMIKRIPGDRGGKLRILIGIAIIFMLAQSAVAQRPYDGQALIHSDMPPGLAAETCRVANPQALTFHTQHVRLIVPEGALLEVGINGTFAETHSSRVTLGMSVGPVYRLKVTHIPRHFGRELFPSIEILDRLNPPPGLESKFPIQVVLSQDDLEQALEGRLVTKVIYLEDPETALPHRHSENSQPYFDVGGGEDPLRAAKRLGRPMAIVRVGSRVPTYTDDDLGFGFNGAPIMIPQPERSDLPQNGETVGNPEPTTHGNSETPMAPDRSINGNSTTNGSSTPSVQVPQQAPTPYSPPNVPDEIQ